MRSMPLYSELSTSAVGYWDLMDSDKKKSNYTETSSTTTDPKLLTLQRCQSEKNDSSVNGYSYNGAGKNGYNGYVVDGPDSEVSGPFQRKWGNEESLCSDVGPSPSVVAAAIAKGLYHLPAPPRTMESSVIDGLSESNRTEGMNTKIERWRSEMTPAYDKQGYLIVETEEKKKKLKQTPKRNGKPQQPTKPRGSGLCSCFGTAFGCEFSISCGGKGKKKRGSDKTRHPTAASELTYEESSIF